MSYANIADVQARVGDIVSSRIFTSSTVPTAEEVENILDGVSAEFDAELAGAGYAVPLDEITDTTAHAWARRAQAAFASAYVLNLFPGAALDPNDDSPISNRRSGLFAEGKRFLEAVQKQRLAATRTTSRLGRMKVGSATDSNGLTKKPTFTRGMFDYPGSVSRVE
jgi:hypothetical protein